MEFKAKRRKLSVEIEGVKHIVRFPLLGELDEYRESSEKGEAKDSVKALAVFLSKLGLPEDAQKMLEPSDLTEVVNLLTDQKKTT